MTIISKNLEERMKPKNLQTKDLRSTEVVFAATEEVKEEESFRQVFG